MFIRRRFLTWVLAVSLTGLAAAAAAPPTQASFHIMQIEQVIGGVDGAAVTQAVQLRMRSAGQNLVASARLYAWDAAGENPVLLIDFPANVSNGASGARVLVASADFSSKTDPPLTPDFVFTNLIPESYLAAGSLTFEDNFGSVYWRLSWGGDDYTGSGGGLTTNDADGNFNPPFANQLPSGTAQALLIQIAGTAPSTNNAANYLVTEDAAVFTNNAGASGTVQTTVDVDDSANAGRLSLGAPFPNPARGAVFYSIDLPRAARARITVHEVSGRRVALLADRVFAAGRHDLSWNASLENDRLASGVYFLELRVDGDRRVRPIVVLH